MIAFPQTKQAPKESIEVNDEIQCALLNSCNSLKKQLRRKLKRY